MRKLKIVFALAIIVGIVFSACNIMQNKNLIINKKEVQKVGVISPDQKIGHIYIDFDFGKADLNMNPLEGARFKLSAYNNVYSTYSIPDGDGVYIFDYSAHNTSSYNKILKSLSNSQKELIDSIKTTNDLKKLEYVYCFDDDTCFIALPTIFVIEEVQAPNGYAKTKVVAPGEIIAVYSLQGYHKKEVDYLNSYRNTVGVIPGEPIPSNVDEVLGDEDGEIELVELDSRVYPFGFMEYGEVDLEELVGTNVDEIKDIWFQYLDPACMRKFKTPNEFSKYSKASAGSSIPDTLDECGVIKDYKGSASLSINTTVNEKESISTTANSKLNYRISISNNGNIPSLDNKVVSKLPDGFNYVEGSASNNGKYDQSTNTITWIVYRLEDKDSLTLTYDAYAPEGLSSLKNYVGEASIESFSVSNRVESNKTTVRLMINPKTNAPLFGIGITLIIVWGVALYLYIDHKRNGISLNS